MPSWLQSPQAKWSAAAILEQRKRSRESVVSYAPYQADPVGFCRNVLEEDSFTDDVQRMMLSVRDNSTTLAASANATGKTHGAARVAVWFFKCFPDSQVFTAAAPPEDNLKRLLWGQIGALLASQPALFAGDKTSNLHIGRSPNSYITGVAIPSTGTVAEREAKFSGKHAPNLLFIVDEGDAVPPEVYAGIESCMSGGHARLLILYNRRAKAGPVWIKEREKEGNLVELRAFEHPNVVSGEDVIPGAVTREVTVRRINQWSRPLALGEEKDAEAFEVPKFLVGVVARSLQGQALLPLEPGWRHVTNPALAYMTLARYPGQAENQLIDSAWIDAAVNRWVEYTSRNGEKAIGSPIMGQDVAELGLDANVSAFRYPNGFVPRFEGENLWTGIDVYQTSGRAANLFKKRQAVVCFVDATGVGAGVAPHMRAQGCAAYGVKVASSPTVITEQGKFHILRDQLLWAVREWLRTDRKAMIPPDEQLREELGVLTYAVVNGQIRIVEKDVIREKLKRSPDKLDGLAQTFSPGYGNLFGPSAEDVTQVVKVSRGKGYWKT